jgi:hypothetical protein
MRLIPARKLALRFVWLTVTVAAAAFAQSVPAAHNDVLIKNATVMTVTHGNIKNGSVYIKDGKIAAVGENLSAPTTVIVIDAGGKYLTPGIVDSHSHIALDDDVNDATSPITPQMMMKDAFDYQDKAIYRALAGGVTTSLLLHGSANMIGGQAVVIKHKYGASRDELLFPNAPRSIKFASGENPSASTAREISCLRLAWAILPSSARLWFRHKTTCASGMLITKRSGAPTKTPRMPRRRNAI